MKHHLFLFSFLLLFIDQSAAQKSTILIKTKDFTLLFPGWQLENNYFEIDQRADSTFLALEEGESPEGELFEITKLVRIREITQHYRTSISISHEGQHWDLFDWKHFVSQKTQLIPNAGHYTVLKYSEDQKNVFPEYKEKDLISYVSNHSPHARALIYKDEKLSGESLYHSISEIYLTIMYLKPGSSRVSKHVIVFHLPLGC